MGLSTTTEDGAARVVHRAAAKVQENVRATSAAAYASVRGEAERVVGDRRDAVASYAHDVADALSGAADTLQERHRSAAADLTRRLATEIDAVSGRVEGQDIGSALRRVEDFAYRRPALFFGGAFVLGFALIHLLRQPVDEAAGAPATAIAD